MTPVRGPRGRCVHLTADLRTTLCGRKVERWRIEPDQPPTCVKCAEVDLDIANWGN